MSESFSPNSAQLFFKLKQRNIVSRKNKSKGAEQTGKSMGRGWRKKKEEKKGGENVLDGGEIKKRGSY